MEWMKQMYQRASGMPDIRACIDELEKWEGAYYALRDSLLEEQRTVLESYICACEELDHAMLRLAYEEGKERAKQER